MCNKVKSEQYFAVTSPIWVAVFQTSLRLVREGQINSQTEIINTQHPKD